MRDILRNLLLHSQKWNLFRCINYKNYDKNQNQDIKYPEKNRGHWASSDVTEKDVISDDVIFTRLISLLNYNTDLPSFVKILKFYVE